MASIRDIAKLAGVSPATVSRILNNDPSFSINKNTRARVIEIANRVHYSKKNAVRGPKSTGDGMSIGLILRHNAQTEENDPYFKNIHRGIEEEAAFWRLRTETVFTMHDKNKDWDQLSKYGAIIIVGEMTPDAIERVKSLNPNLFLVDARPQLKNCSYIQNDFSNKTAEILDYLYKNGHRNIAYIGGKSSIVDQTGKTIYLNNDVRAGSYEKWMKLHGLEKYINYILGDWTAESGLKSGEKLAQLDPLPTAVVVGSDPMAIGVYKAFANKGIKIPTDVSVVSFDDVDLNRYLTPTLSSVYMDSAEMGRTAVRLAKDAIIEKTTFALTVTCRSELRIRESVTKRN
ncbi:LacI family DNA-binding transcriptional regulator [Lactobacillus crispatus]|uniref:Substrate-binding domain-containing protein n=1 Tax=Lactobacillus crispatus TaxID=47770 RepID=A0A7H9EA62_9LACO|nr:LacI family DNA-binding transcriptional regulator [Lactobacillus crispatus]KAA8792583.1 LacI family transcriptional regulator [Lactobacillus crispatus]KAA8802121.1 LacI family transcriptional regulator [Lactobacillus crispatus]QLL74583.1 substrate-binding domain-containing protein [Lactobacillus crispatus]